jgi:hypothetical protein
MRRFLCLHNESLTVDHRSSRLDGTGLFYLGNADLTIPFFFMPHLLLGRREQV